MNVSRVKDQMLPSPDEAPLTECPWCGEEYNTNDTHDPYEFYDTVVESTPATKEILRHKKCGNLVRFVGTGPDA